MKKLASLLVALCLGAFIVGCNGEDEPAPAPAGGGTPPAGGAGEPGGAGEGM